MTNFGIRWGTTLSLPPKLAYSQTLGFVPGGGDALPSVIPGMDSLPQGITMTEVIVQALSDRFGIPGSSGYIQIVEGSKWRSLFF